MVDKDKKSGGSLDVAPYSQAVAIIAQSAVDGAGSFLSRICNPAAEEFGLFLRDKVRDWRASNAVKIVLKSEEIYEKYLPGENLYAHPRLVMKAIEEGSWVEDEKVQEMWAGLLSSACSEDGKDETNLIFMNLLSQITSAQASILDYAGETCKKHVSADGFLYSDRLQLELKELIEVANVSDIHRLDRELDYLRDVGLISKVFGGGFGIHSAKADVTPSTLALHMYARCNGYNGSPVDFYGLGNEGND